MIKILGISGSPRGEGNTSLLVKKALEVCRMKGAETEYISLAGKEILYCVDCNACVLGNNFLCPKQDDVSGILEAMTSSDALIIGSPTYFSSVSGQLKALFDRTLPLRRNNFQLSGKVGGAIAVGGSRNGGQEFVIRDIHNWMLLHEMIVVADRKTAHFGGIAVGRGLGDTLGDDVGLATVENLATRVYDVASGMEEK
ncbi:MAG: flavodoxin family protein [Candidatus Altiarchaeota archaeon]|nr:flavodoxin family protein [Candidatus Altiarchaeota archaeon]